MTRFCLWLLALAPLTVAPGAVGGADGAHSCAGRVIDPDHFLTQQEAFDLLNGANLLANKVPADYHIILLRTTEQDVRVAAEDYCPEWKPGPRRTENLLVVANAPNERRGAVFYGDALAAKLDDRWREVFNPSFNPYYRQNRLARGLRETTARLQMILSPEEAAAPQKAEAPVATPEPETMAQNPWDNQTDKLVGWVFWSMPWVFGLAVLSFLGKVVFANSPSSDARTARHEQDLAKAKLQLVRDKSSNVDHDLTATALKGLEVGELRKEYDKILDDSAWLQLKCDPQHDGLQASEYADMRAQYERIYQRFDRITQTLRAKLETLPRFDGFRANHVGPTDASGRPQPGSSLVPPIIHQHHDGGGGLAAGLIIGSLLSSDHHREQSESSQALFDRREDGPLWGSSGDTGGTVDYGSSSSSDTGGSVDSGSSSSGGDTGGSVDT